METYKRRPPTWDVVQEIMSRAQGVFLCRLRGRGGAGIGHATQKDILMCISSYFLNYYNYVWILSYIVMYHYVWILGIMMC